MSPNPQPDTVPLQMFIFYKEASLIHSINEYISSRSSPVILRSRPISSAKDIIKLIQFLLEEILDFPSTKIEDDLFIILKSWNCPFKVNKSTLLSPNSPHSWPFSLAIIEWLVQIAKYNEHLATNSKSFAEEENHMLAYLFESYLHSIRGDDDLVHVLDREFIEKVEGVRDVLLGSVEVLEAEFNEIEAKSEAMKAADRKEREDLEENRSLLEGDLRNFHAIIAHYYKAIVDVEKVLDEKMEELEINVKEKKRIAQENEELKKTVNEQSINLREFQAVERDIEQAETARNALEEKNCNLDAYIGLKLKELADLVMKYDDNETPHLGSAIEIRASLDI